MGLKCSMFGHSFGDPEVEREREENGEEVVVTVREVKVCSRCGAESVVSENKEVTSLRQPPSDDGDDDAPDDSPTDASGDTETPDEAAPNLDAVEDEGAELLGEDDPVFDDGDAADDGEAADADDEDTAAEAEPPSAAVPVEDDPDESPAVADEDAAIVDAEADETDESDEDPADAGDAAADEDPPVADPEDLLPEDAVEEAEPDADEAPDDAEGATEEAPDDDGVILDEAESEPAAERSRGEWPDSSDVGPPAGESETDTWPEDAGGTAAETARRDAESAERTEDAGAVETGIASAGRAPAADQPTDPGDAELFCPSCSYTASLDRASLRVGDICPECKRGYLSERQG